MHSSLRRRAWIQMCATLAPSCATLPHSMPCNIMFTIICGRHASCATHVRTPRRMPLCARHLSGRWCPVSTTPGGARTCACRRIQPRSRVTWACCVTGVNPSGIAVRRLELDELDFGFAAKILWTPVYALGCLLHHIRVLVKCRARGLKIRRAAYESR